MLPWADFCIGSLKGRLPDTQQVQEKLSTALQENAAGHDEEMELGQKEVERETGKMEKESKDNTGKGGRKTVM